MTRTTKIYNALEHKDYCLGVWNEIYKSSASGIASSEWIQTLLNLHRDHFNCSIFFVVEENGCPIGITFFGRKTIYRNAFVFSKTLNMNASGCKQIDLLWIEDNDICSYRSRREIVAKMVVQALTALENWDEVSFPGVYSSSALSRALKAAAGGQLRLLIQRRSPNYVVDLKKLADGGKDYLATLDNNARYEVHRVIRQFEGIGSPSVSEPHSVAEGLAWMREMKQFSIMRMRAIGQTSSFEHEAFCRFHEEYFTRVYPSGRVLLQRFMVGDSVVGYHYNLLSDGRLYFYQCGYNYGQFKKFKPGIYCHYLNIVWAAARGFSVYDFMPGEARYKRELSGGNISEYGEWLVLRRPKVAFAIEDCCKKVRIGLRKMLMGRS